jgi:hypothetical protein
VTIDGVVDLVGDDGIKCETEMKKDPLLEKFEKGLKPEEPEVPGDDPDLQCPRCGSWRTSRFFRRYKYSGGVKTEETRMQCVKCGNRFFVNKALED